jgi:hypothetical protein
LRCEGTKIWRDQILDKRFRNIGARIGIRRILGCNKKEQCQNIGLKMGKSEVEINLDDQ